MSKNIVRLTYLQYFNDLEMVDSYAWGVVALTHLYKAITIAPVRKVKVVVGYMFPEVI
jgi:hypothetical protein